MKKLYKRIIVLILSLIFLAILVISIAIGFVFTPEKLTPVVRTQAAKYITCPSKIGEVELTFFSTFPKFGLKVNHFALINPTPKAPADTLVRAGQFVGIVDLVAWWKRNELVITELQLENGIINAFTDSLGRTNFDIVRTDTTTTTTSVESTNKPFHFINIGHVALNNVSLLYIDQSQKLQAKVENLTGQFSGSFSSDTINTQMNIGESKISVEYDGEKYLQSALIKLTTDVQFIVSKQSVAFRKAEGSINNRDLTFDGSIRNDAVHQQVGMDLNYQFKSWPVPDLLALIPPTYQSYIKDIESIDGLITSDGKIRGIYSDSKMPLMDLHLIIQNGSLKYAGVPVPLSQIEGDAVFYSNLTNDELSYVRINQFSVKTPQSSIKTAGNITHLFTDMQCDLSSEATIWLAEWAPMIPAKMKMAMKGKVSGQVKSMFTMSQVEKMQFDRLKMSGTVELSEFDVTYDSLSLKTDYSKVDFALPNPNSTSKNTPFVWAKMNTKLFEASKMGEANAYLKNAQISLETSNVMDTTRIPDVACTFTLDSLAAGMDTIKFAAQKPSGQFTLFQQKRKKNEPELKLNFSCGNLASSMGSGSIRMNKVKLNADALKDKIRPQIKLNYSGENLKMAMGNDSARMNKIELNADVVNDPHQKDIFLQWLVKGFMSVDKGVVNMASIKYPLEIPSIKMDFDPETFNIKESKLKIDRSDFSLSGKLSNVLSYFRKDSLLRGNFDFVSKRTDALQLMMLTNGLGDQSKVETKPTTSSTNSAWGPYMVPKGMDMLLNVNIGTATFGTDTARVIKGGVRVKDGLLVLDNFDFVTPAARMQLTSMYRTPRRNHLFMGLECHMLDVEIEELLKIIPDIDSMMPMLRSFKGKGEFHMAVETYLDSLYNPKKSTIRGAASIKGQDLVLMDGPTYREIAKTLRFNKNTHNKVDSLSAEFTAFKQEIDVYPFLIVMDKYKAIVAGRHNMDLSFDYHISVVDSPLPLKFGVNVSGTMDDMKYGLAKCKYAEFYRPTARYEVQNKQLELRNMIRDALTGKIKKE